MCNRKKQLAPLKIILLVLLVLIIFVLSCIIYFLCYGYILRHVAIGMAVSHLESKYSERMVLLHTEYYLGWEEPSMYYVYFHPESDPQMECAVMVYQAFWGSPKLYLPNETDPEFPCQADTYLIQTLTKEMTPVYQEFFDDCGREGYEIILGFSPSRTKFPLHPDMKLDELEKGVNYKVCLRKDNFFASDLQVLWDLYQWCVCNHYEPQFIRLYCQEGPTVYFTLDEVSHLNGFEEFVEYLVEDDWTIGEYLNP